MTRATGSAVEICVLHISIVEAIEGAGAMEFYRHCTYCAGFGQPGPGCSCTEPCRYGCCPAVVESQRVARAECVTYSPEYEPQDIPVLEGSTRTGGRRCANCEAAAATTTRGGYACCESCAVLADLPPHLRGTSSRRPEVPAARRRDRATERVLG